VEDNEPKKARLTRAQVASRLGVSVSTVRRFEGTRLHPTLGDNDVRSFDEMEVAALAAELANEPRAHGDTQRDVPRSRGELAALVFERFEQRQSLAEIVVGLRIEPEVVRALFDQWSLGLVEGQLRMNREPLLPRVHEIPRFSPEQLAKRLEALPTQLVRISVGRYRGPYVLDSAYFADVVELGGFHVSGPCSIDAITDRFGPGDYRISAYAFEPAGLLWESIVEGL
jgi:transcriptional regulator with XRE-family HTH domain